MPIYEYRCEKGHDFEVMQKMSDGPVTVCEVCEAPVRKVFRPIAVHFKGSGFYNTDYGTRNRSREKEAAEGANGEGAKREGAKDSKDSKDSKESKESKSDSKSDSSKSKSDSGAPPSTPKAAAGD